MATATARKIEDNETAIYNYRDLADKLCADYPTADVVTLAKRFQAAIRKEPGYLWTLSFYTMTRAKARADYKPDPGPEENGDEEEQEAIKQAASRLKFLDLIMPNGKKLRDCTRDDVEQFVGWGRALAKLMKRKGTVGEQFTEEQLHKALDKKLK